jgi:hypothetical protein
MFMAPIEPSPGRGSYIVVRLLRRWAAAGIAGDRLPSLVRLATRLGIGAHAAVALASLFQLTEACLGRTLVCECCCSPRLSRDERAVLALLTAEMPLHPNQASPSIPHGLPGALVWAVASIRRLMDEPMPSVPAPARHCPFVQG